MALGNPSNPFSLFSYPRIGVAIPVPVLPISDAVHCNPSCSALQPTSQCTASNTEHISNRSRKRLREDSVCAADRFIARLPLFPYGLPSILFL